MKRVIARAESQSERENTGKEESGGVDCKWQVCGVMVSLTEEDRTTREKALE